MIVTTPLVMEGRMTLRSDRTTVRLIVVMATLGALIASRAALAQQPADAPVEAVETARPAQIVLPDGVSLNASSAEMRAAIRRVTKSQSLLVSTADASAATPGAPEV